MTEGRPRVMVAVDLGGSYTKIALATADGTLYAEERRATALGENGGSADQGETTAVWLGEQIKSYAAEHRSMFDIAGFGVAVPGVIDTRAGVVRAATNIGWRDMPLRDRLIEATQLSGQVGHDVRAGGLAEWRLGAGKDVANLIFIPLGTGTAAAMVVDGAMLEADGYAGEIGHTKVPAAGDLVCRCGRVGCLEIVSSAAGVIRSYGRRAGGQVHGGAEIAALARAGDRSARAAFELAVQGLVEALDTAVVLLGPELIIIGGGLSAAADLLIPPLQTRLTDMLGHHRIPAIVPAMFGSRAGMVGAGLLGWAGTDKEHR